MTPTARLRIRAHRSQRGYVLLVTLGLLVLSSTLLVATGRAAAQHALDARLAQSQLQQRWGVVSSRAAVLNHCERILVSLEQQQKRPVPEYRCAIQLGGESFTLIVADEQAKANANLLLDQFGVEGAGDRLVQSLMGSGLMNHLRLRPSVFADDSSPPTTQPLAVPQLLSGPGQMFDAVAPAQLIAPMQSLTFWGGGALNVMRATEESMQMALTPALTRVEVARLLAARDQNAQLSVESHLGSTNKPVKNNDAIGSLLAQANIDPKVRNRLSLIGGSRCHSLWIIATDARRSWYSLVISDESIPNHPRIRSLVW